MYLQINFFLFGLQGKNQRYKVLKCKYVSYTQNGLINIYIHEMRCNLNRNVFLLLIIKDTNRSYIININISTQRNKRFIKKKGKTVLITESI